MKYFTKEIGDKEINFRLRNADITEIEKKNNVSIQQYVMDATFDKATTLIRYMRKSSDPNFSVSQAQDFMDELVDEGYSLETIFTDIIFPTCVESGIITTQDLNKIMEAITEQHNRKPEESAK